MGTDGVNREKKVTRMGVGAEAIESVGATCVETLE